MDPLNTLASNLRAQAAAKSAIVLDKTVFPDSVLTDIRTAFALAAGEDLTITGVRATDIPDPVINPATGLLTLTISAGTAALLKQSGVGMALTFTVPSQALVAVITATLSTTWKFSDSFSELEDTFPFQDLKTSNVHFVYATAGQASYPWPGKPTDSIALQPGLNFLSEIKLDNFRVIQTLLGELIGTSAYKFYGPFAPTTGQALPVGIIQAPLGTGSFDIGVAPNALTLGSPAVAVQIDPSDPDDPIQDIDLVVQGVLNNILQVAVSIPMSGSALSISTTPLPHQDSINNLIESLPGGSGFTTYIPQELSSIFAEVGLDNFSMVVDPTPQVTYLGLAISTINPWPVIADTLILDTLSLQIQVVDPTGQNWQRVFIDAQAEFFPKIFSGKFDFAVGLQKQTSWEVSTVSGAYYGTVNLGDIVGGLLGNPNSVPDVLRAIQFSDFGVDATRSAPGSPFTYSFYGNVEAAFPLLDKELTAQLSLAVTKTPTSYTIVLNGSLVIGEQVFDLTLDVGTANAQLSAMWSSTGAPLGFEDIATALGFTPPDIPDGLDLSLESASFTYDFTNHDFVFTAATKNYGDLVFVAAKPSDSWVFVVLVAISKIELTKLPLVGEEVGKLGKFEIDDLNFLACSGKIAPDQVRNINQLIEAVAQKTGATLPTLPEPAAGLQQGGNLSMTFYIADHAAPVALGTATAKSGGSQSVISLNQAGADGQATTALVLADPNSGSNNLQTQNGYWINLQKAFGPVYMDKIGFTYADGAIEILFNFSLKLGALTITLDGLMVGSPLTKFDPFFGLQGLSITFNSDVVEISGGFIRQDIDGVTQYNGQALIKAGTFALSAMGSYAKVNGETSMFIFALLDAQLGGPAFFFVTGLAAGFGYNRGLVIPTIDQIATFPLVSGFVPNQSSPFSGSDPGAALQVLVSKNIVPIQIGQNWLAAGIQFTSFEMLQSFALVVVEFGASLEIALLGMTTASIPTGDPRPLLFAQLAIEVRILPDEGLFAVDAKLTSSSYLLDQSCHLTGGFAFYLWFGSNAHAGDFVITLGGYHPNFNKPDHYPDVPRLGFNWVVTSELTIKGGMYFALTPVCLMAGGSLQALWQSGNLKAWFDMGADFLIAWKPYHYEIDVYLSFGVSYTFNINLLFVTITKTISVSLGADLSIWGPAFSGVAHIHLWIISFTVRFGASSSQTPPPIPWSEFEQSFLPPAANASQQQKRMTRRLMKTRANAALADAPATQRQVWTVSVTTGLVRSVAPGADNPDDIDWIVNPDGAVLQAKTSLPAKEYTLVVQGTDTNGKLVPVCSSQIVITNKPDLDGINVAFGVGPSDVASDDFKSGMTVTLTYEDSTISSDQIFYFTAIIQTAPKALWLPGKPDITNKETLVSNVLLGFEITTGQKQPDETPWADVSQLGFVDYDYRPSLEWAAPDVVDGPEQPTDPFDQLEKTIVTAPSRAGILASLAAGGTPIGSNVDVQYMAAKASDFLLAPPVFAFEYALPG